MARTTGSSGVKTVETIKREATRLIYKHGYEAMNLRMLAQAVGIQPGSLYNHIASKAELLYTLLDDVMQELLDGVEETLQGSTSSSDALRRVIAFHIQFHAERKEDVFIGNAELRSLEPEHFQQIARKRQKYETRLAGILEDGVSTKEFDIPNIKVSTFAIIAMLTGVCTWYRSDGPLSITDLIDIYTVLVMKSITRSPVSHANTALPA